MSMYRDRKSRNIKLGVFVTAGVILLFAALFYMGQKWSMFGKSIPLSAIFTDVKGLQEGNNVQFMGITVGTVKEITILSATATRVDMAIDPKMGEFIKRDAVAQIGTEGLMGNIIVKISPVSETAATAEAGAVLKSKPGVVVDSLIKALQVTNDQTQVLAQNLGKISEQVLSGHGAVGKLLMDSVMADKLSQAIGYLQQTSAQSNNLMYRLNQIAYKMDRGHGPMGAMLNDTVVENDLKEAIRQIKITSEQSAVLSAELTDVAKQVNNGSGMAHTLLRDSTFVSSIEQSIEEIRHGTVLFSENMEALQHNFLLRGFFRKRAKREAQEAADSTAAEKPVSQAR